MSNACHFIGIATFCGDVADFFTSPLWYWGLWWLAIVVASWVVGWFFAPARPIAGVIVIAATFGLVALWYGLKLGKERERAKRPPSQPQPQQPTAGPFDLNWLWSWK